MGKIQVFINCICNALKSVAKDHSKVLKRYIFIIIIIINYFQFSTIA